MTQIDELVKRATSARDWAVAENDHIEPELLIELVDALEAQAARGKELERENEQLREQREQLSKAVNGVLVVNRSEYAAARITTIEAQLEAFREALSAIGDFDATEPYRITVRAIKQIARDALMSALRNAEGEKDGVE